jgi:hypothetical protein
MKNISIPTLLAFILICSCDSPAVAAGSDSYRNVTSNNILSCPTNQQIENFWYGGTGSSYGSNHVLICLDGDRKAKWVIDSGVQCQSGVENCPYDIDTESADYTYTFKYRRTGIGTNCNIVKKTGEYGSTFYYWSCQKYTSRQNLTIITKGNEPLLSTGGLFTKYGKIPSEFEFDTSDDPSCTPDSSPCTQEYPGLGGDGETPPQRTYQDCVGDAQFCS